MSEYSLPRPIAEDDETSAFDSGEPSLDEDLRRRALTNHVQGAGRCFVTCRDGRVVGYYALTPASVQHRDVAGSVRRNMAEPIPVILLSRLAVDRQEQGYGLGKNLLRDALLRSVDAAESVGVRALLVHAEAGAFAALGRSIPDFPAPAPACPAAGTPRGRPAPRHTPDCGRPPRCAGRP